MKAKLTLFLTLVCAFLVPLALAQAQTTQISGTVTDEDGVPIPGVNITVENTSFGTSSDFDGNYSISAERGQILLFTSVGFQDQMIPVGEDTTVNITLQAGTALDEVVVTAMGIRRKPRELSYSVSSVESEQLTAANSVNAAASMVGKVSGLQINVVNNGVNPATRVILRGNRSLLNNNEALVVIDGFPTARGALDRINPEDIESINVLKGANASALYGSEAANGVLVIETKKGSGKLNIELNSSVELETISYMPGLQDEFGAGGFPDGTIRSLENVAWGPRFDPSIMVPISETYENGDVWEVPYAPIHNNLKNFFDDALSYRNGVTISSGDEGGSILFSVDHLDKKGVVPKDKFETTNVRLNASKNVGDFEFNGSFALFHSRQNIVSDETGRQDRPLYWSVLNTPLNVPLTEMKDWRDGYFTRNEVSFYRFYENPYFLIDSDRDKSEFNSVQFVGDASYHITDWLTATARAGYYTSHNVFDRTRGGLEYAFHVPNPYGEMDPYGADTENKINNFSRLNTDFLISIDKDFLDRFNVKANLGESIRIDKSNSIEVSGSNLIIPGFYNISTRTGELGGKRETEDYKKIGVFADVTLGYDDWLFLNFSGRNDWSSALSKENRSFFYPGGGISVLLTEALPGLKSDVLSYFKLSGNVTKSGNDPEPYKNRSTFAAPDGFPFDNTAGLSQSNTEADPDLKPEFTLSREIGIELAFWKNRINTNLSLYQTNTTDQIISISSSYASGASTLLTNIGELQSRGIEWDLNAAIIDNGDFRWDIGYNYSNYGDNKVLSLSEGVDELTVGGYTDAFTVAQVGSPFPILKVIGYERDDLGRVIVGANGDPIEDSNLHDAGRTTPIYTMGLNTTLTFKGIKLFASADYRKGGVFYNNMTGALEFTGLTPHSVTAGRNPFVFPNSSYMGPDGEYVANTDRLTSNGGNAFWSSYSDISENYIYDASYVKIREISLSYDFANLLNTGGIGLNALNLTAYTRNPWTFRPKDNKLTDPEFNYSTGNIIGIGNQVQMPPTRTFGLKLTAKF